QLTRARGRVVAERAQVVAAVRDLELAGQRDRVAKRLFDQPPVGTALRHSFAQERTSTSFGSSSGSLSIPSRRSVSRKARTSETAWSRATSYSEQTTSMI